MNRSALDLKLRANAAELKNATVSVSLFIFVTHDQGEALSMSDRVAVFNNGRIEQVDSPRDLYMRPRTPFVAGFVGTSMFLWTDGRETLWHDGKLRTTTGTYPPQHFWRNAG